jgi:Fe2+ or Zn2+ uptake regulation protein
MTMRPVKDVRKMIQNQIGAKATLTFDDIPGTSVQMGSDSGYNTVCHQIIFNGYCPDCQAPGQL